MKEGKLVQARTIQAMTANMKLFNFTTYFSLEYSYHFSTMKNSCLAQCTEQELCINGQAHTGSTA